MAALYNGSGTMIERYVHGSNVDADDPPIWFNSSSTADANRHYLYADPRGSIIAAVNYTGTSVGRNTYDEFGIPGSQILWGQRALKIYGANGDP